MGSWGVGGSGKVSDVLGGENDEEVVWARLMSLKRTTKKQQQQIFHCCHEKETSLGDRHITSLTRTNLYFKTSLVTCLASLKLTALTQTLQRQSTQQHEQLPCRIWYHALVISGNIPFFLFPKLNVMNFKLYPQQKPDPLITRGGPG